jgi:hypothetical protein
VLGVRTGVARVASRSVWSLPGLRVRHRGIHRSPSRCTTGRAGCSGSATQPASTASIGPRIVLCRGDCRRHRAQCRRGYAVRARGHTRQRAAADARVHDPHGTAARPARGGASAGPPDSGWSGGRGAAGCRTGGWTAQPRYSNECSAQWGEVASDRLAGRVRRPRERLRRFDLQAPAVGNVEPRAAALRHSRN